jgi:hypothetical protein
MRTNRPTFVIVVLAVLASTITAIDAQESSVQPTADSSVSNPDSFLQSLALPPSTGPVVVKAEFFVQEIGDVDDEAETFEFTGILATRWNDPRQAFDPIKVGCSEKVYQGNYQFDELSPGWFPQIILVNESSMDQRQAVILRVQPNGDCAMLEKIDAIAETQLNLMSFPFDRQTLEARFEILGFDASEVCFETGKESLGHDEFKVPQWTITGGQLLTQVQPKPLAGLVRESSELVMQIEVRRNPSFMMRLVIIPLVLIVVLSWSVFWMDRSSLGDRINVSFIGILTVVAYQIVVSDILPRISYITCMTAFLNISFWMMCLTVVVNLMVGEADKKGHVKRGDQIDLYCRWIFPLVYFGLLIACVIIASGQANTP